MSAPASNGSASSGRGKPKKAAAQGTKRKAEEQAPEESKPAPVKKENKVPDKYNPALLPEILLNKWNIGSMELLAGVTAGGTKREHMLKIMTPPCIVRMAQIHGLGAKGFKKDFHSEENKYKLELVVGLLPKSIMEKNPGQFAQHQAFIDYVEFVCNAAMQRVKKDSNVRPGWLDTCKDAVKMLIKDGEIPKEKKEEEIDQRLAAILDRADVRAPTKGYLTDLQVQTKSAERFASRLPGNYRSFSKRWLDLQDELSDLLAKIRDEGL